jgi:hypothetical protein
MANNKKEYKMKKALKLSAASHTYNIGSKEHAVARLTFQNYKDGYEDDGSDVIIYRREAPGFIFGYDEEEYFDCLPLPTTEEMIFRGRLPDLHTFCEYDDKTAEIGKVYAYWVGKGEIGEALTGPVAIKLRDSRVWWSYDKIVSKIYELKKQFPAIEMREVGKTVMGRPLLSLSVGNKSNMIACVGAIHPGESGPEILLTALHDILTSDPHTFDLCGIALLPVVNADIREKMTLGAPWYIRKNERGVDLNRNFDAHWEEVSYGYGLASDDPKSPTYRGPYPNSEPETQAVIEFIEYTKPHTVFSYHWLCSVCTDRLISSFAAKDDCEYKEKLHETSLLYSKGFRESAELFERSVNDVALSSSAGGLSTWLYKRGIVGFDLEMSEELVEIFPSSKDITTHEMLSRATAGHKQGLLNIIQLHSKKH